ncbi:hypothetical protein [Streptomyces hainanensis]|uniref:Uncharacterized protein n=1 Tax=Streptomyces hainanensis TaxID=402648 RepID=A0A4R4SMU2_9ACTN|nr:hypothetical protein [Streptomyces hainanensis]TDC62943.1 hypothetical protein E1283_33205 [Streptomyces hainanensis]
MDRLSEITFRLPATPASRAFLGELATLWADVPYAGGDADGGLCLTPPHPAGAHPVTTFRLADVPTPEVVFSTGHAIGVWESAEPPEDHVHPAPVELADLTRRLAGQVRRIDHTGVNVPSRFVPPEGWRDLVSGLAASSALYRYPTGEEWPFVLPSTPDELADDIRDFVVGREPRFELVHETRQTRTLWQFALWTDLTRAELQRLFPEPEGFTFPELADVFRVVPVASPWPDLGLRFDLCYRVDAGPTDWETGEWLVTEGGRVR